MKKILNIFNLIEWIFIFIFLITIIVISILTYKSIINIFELISVILGLLSAMLNIKSKRYTFIFYALYVLLYGIISLFNKNYGEGILNLAYNFPLYLFTIYNIYFVSKRNENNMVIKSLTKKGWLTIVILIPCIIIIYGFILKLIKSNLPFINSFATSVAIIATFLLNKRYYEQWYFWILYSLALIILWLFTFMETKTSGILYLLLNFFYVIINIYGLVSWKKMLNK